MNTQIYKVPPRPPPRLCIDCKHCKPDMNAEGEMLSGTCERTVHRGVSLVTGKLREWRSLRECEYERGRLEYKHDEAFTEQLCGPDGRWFESKEAAA